MQQRLKNIHLYAFISLESIMLSNLSFYATTSMRIMTLGYKLWILKTVLLNMQTYMYRLTVKICTYMHLHPKYPFIDKNKHLSGPWWWYLGIREYITRLGKGCVERLWRNEKSAVSLTKLIASYDRNALCNESDKSSQPWLPSMWSGK